jgi:hypothetical protein
MSNDNYRLILFVMLFLAMAFSASILIYTITIVKVRQRKNMKRETLSQERMYALLYEIKNRDNDANDKLIINSGLGEGGGILS